MQTVQEKIELLHEKLAKVKAGGGEKRVEKQHSQGKMTARERLAKLFDDNSFVELDQFVKHRCVNFGQDKKELPGTSGNGNDYVDRGASTSSLPDTIPQLGDSSYIRAKIFGTLILGMIGCMIVKERKKGVQA